MYHVEKLHSELGWRKVPFAESRVKAYCQGFVDACDSFYPSDPMRIVRTNSDGSTKVVLETNGRGKVHTN